MGENRQPKYYSSASSGRDRMPLHSDSLLHYLFKSFMGALFLGIFLFIVLPGIKEDSVFSEIFIIIIMIIVSDAVGAIFAYYLIHRINKKYGYKSSFFEVEMKNYIQYTLYLLIRVTFFVLGTFKIICEALMDVNVYYLFAVLLACILINLIGKVLSWAIVHTVFL